NHLSVASLVSLTPVFPPYPGLSSWSGEFQVKFYSLNGKTEEEQQQFIKEYIINDKLLYPNLLIGQNRFWFPGPGVWINCDKSFLLWTDGGNRLSIISTQKGGNIKEVLTRLYIGQLMTEELFKKEQPLARDDNLGEGLTCPSSLGAGFKVGGKARFPNLSKQPTFDQVLKTLRLRRKCTGKTLLSIVCTRRS
uniref:Creatine kinase M-type n=1 Tax=Leptobrachium leishanense TaxID=445787 RepID=A0A8C5QPM5_9ANUR